MDVLVIGGGAAGLMAAGTAAKRGLKVTLLERNDKLARKVAITGKGRCNVTNDCPLLNDLIANIPVNGRFLFGAFSRFDTRDTMDFFETRACRSKLSAAAGFFRFPIKRLILLTRLTDILQKTALQGNRAGQKALSLKTGALRALLPLTVKNIMQTML